MPSSSWQNLGLGIFSLTLILVANIHFVVGDNMNNRQPLFLTLKSCKARARELDRRHFKNKFGSLTANRRVLTADLLSREQFAQSISHFLKHPLLPPPPATPTWIFLRDSKQITLSLLLPHLMKQYKIFYQYKKITICSKEEIQMFKTPYFEDLWSSTASWEMNVKNFQETYIEP